MRNGRLFAGGAATIALAGCLALNLPVAGTPASGPAPSGRTGPLYGQILAESGKPAAGVKVTAYRSDASPVSPPAAPMRVHSFGLPAEYRVQAVVEAQTDERGGFVLDPGADGTYNLEAVRNADSKAWKSTVEVSRGANVGVGPIKLEPTGTISGKVRSSLVTVSDFSNAMIYIPGSSYVAIAKNDGSYAISNVPVGRFDLRAYHVDLGDGALPDADNPGQVRVLPRENTFAPPITLMTRPPELLRVTRDGRDTVTDNGAPGTFIDLHGRYFGHRRGTRFAVQFSGGVLQAPERLSDERIRVRVPPDATNGQVNVLVGGLPSQPLPFRAIRSLTLSAESLQLAVGQTYDLMGALEVRDAAGARIVEVRDGETLVKPGPNVRWEVDLPDLAAVTEAGMLQALSEGSVLVKVRAGELPAPAVRVSITGRGGQTPAPTASPATGESPGPTPSPGISASPVPSASPAPSVSPVPTTTPAPTASPAPTPTASPGATPTASPTVRPSPSPTPTASPSNQGMVNTNLYFDR